MIFGLQTSIILRILRSFVAQTVFLLPNGKCFDTITMTITGKPQLGYTVCIQKELAMRVIAGTARGTGLITPQGIKTRPTGDRMKEDLFNILTPLIRDALFLDMYCGSGAIGIEALSRGAKKAIFVDTSKEAIAAVEVNLIKTRLKNRAEVLHMPAGQALKKLHGQMFDIIFMDPPYGDEEFDLSLARIGQGNFLTEKGILVAECPTDAKLPEISKISELIIYRQKKYTQMQFVFYKQSAFA